MAASAQIVHLASARRLRELPERFHQIVAVNIVSNLFSLISEDPIGGATGGAFHQIRQKAMQFRSRMRGAGQATAPKTNGGHVEVTAILLDEQVGRELGN